MTGFEYFVKYFFAPLIIMNTIVGSTLGLIILNKKKVHEIGPRDMYRYLLAIEFLNLLIIPTYLADAFQIQMTVFSNYVCKIYFYLCNALGSTAPTLLVYISIERFVSLTCHSKRQFLRNSKIQSIYFLVIIIYNFLYYSPMPIFYEIVSLPLSGINGTNNQSYEICLIKNKLISITVLYMDLANRVVIPFSLMFIFTILLIGKIFQSRNKFSNKSKYIDKTMHRDIRFTITSILLNLIYLSLNLPASVYWLMPGARLNTPLLYFLGYLIYFAYSLDFFLIYMTNSLVRAEFFRLCKQIKLASQMRSSSMN